MAVFSKDVAWTRRPRMHCCFWFQAAQHGGPHVPLPVTSAWFTHSMGSPRSAEPGQRQPQPQPRLPWLPGHPLPWSLPCFFRTKAKQTAGLSLAFGDRHPPLWTGVSHCGS